MGVLGRIGQFLARPRGMVLIGIVVLAVCGAVLIANAPRAGEDPEASADCSVMREATAEQAASRARACAIDVEIEGERTPWATSWATADGSFRVDVAAIAQRTDVNGEWEAVDTSIVASANAGELSVEAPVYEITLNAGGSAGAGDPLGVIERDGHRMEVRFPLALPEATVRGSSAVYELGPGVRLVVSVSGDGTGFLPIIELDSPSAAAWMEAELSSERARAGLPGTGLEIPFSIGLSAGLTMSADDSGAVEVVDAEGAAVFEAPPSYMWDATGDELAQAAERVAASAGIGEDEAVETVRTEVDRGAFPWPGDRVVLMAVAVSEDTVIVSPDPEMLSNADTVWPVRIDPGFSGHGAVEWVAVRTGGFTSSLWKWTDTAARPGEGSGRCDNAACNTVFTSRLVWAYGGMDSVRNLVGADVVSAEFRVNGTYSYNCDAHATDLWMTGPISTSTTWSNLSWVSKIASRSESHRDICGNNGYREYNATTALKKFAEEDLATITLGLKAADESTMLGWKRFGPDATLSVTYNRAPKTPTSVKMSSPNVGCKTGSARPLINDATPVLSAVGSDPDGGSVTVRFQVVNAAVTAEVWTSGHLAAKASGSTFTTTVPSGELSSGTYGFRAIARDGTRSSAWSSVCEFTVDVAKPVKPTITPVTTGVDAVYSSGVERGGVGMTGKFTVSPGASTDVTTYLYGFGDSTTPKSVAVGADGKATLSFSPTKTGPVTLYVKSKDKAGNVSPVSTHAFDVAYPEEDAIWMLDEGTGNTAADTGPHAVKNPIVDFSGATWGTGPHELFSSRSGDHALVFDGIDDAVGTRGPVVDTSTSFAVSAHVNLNAARVGDAGTFVALSQDDVTRSGFTLGYEGGCTTSGGAGCWSFRMGNAATGTASTAVQSSVPVVGDEWVHLVGQYDKGNKSMSLWVCEIGTPAEPEVGIPVRADAARTATAWKATGKFLIGRGLSGGKTDGRWPGSVDNVRAFSGAVVAESKIRRLCQGAEAADFSDPTELDPTEAEK